MNTQGISVLAVAASVFATGLASAQEKDQSQSTASSTESLAPVSRAVELTVGTGYQQAFGKVASDQPSLTDTADAGGAVQVGVGYRMIPQLTLGVYGSGAMFSRGNDVDSSAKLYSAAAGVQADWHFLPAAQFDPWVSLGSGWRGYWTNTDQGTASLQGMELAKLQVGVDYRIDRAVAISPVVGADLSAFFSQSAAGSSGYQNISNPNVNTFVFAGVQGRFDIPTTSSSQVASR